MNKLLVALIAGAFVLGSGAPGAQEVARGHYPQATPAETARLKAESEAAKKTEANMTPEEKATAKKAKHAHKQKQLSQAEKVGNPNAHANAEAVAKSTEATKSHPKPLPDKESKLNALKSQEKKSSGQ
jgi:hypothetical protein